MDIALGALALPLTLHTAMARRLQVTDAYIIDVITRLAPAVGYPQAAQALLHIGLTPAPDQPHGAVTTRELDFGLRAAGQLLGTTATRGEPSDLHDIIAEYGTLRLPSAERTRSA